MPTSGLYVITCSKDHRFYVGQTIDFKRRENEHFSFLRRGLHHSRSLQTAFILHGQPAFTFRPLVELPPEVARAAEQSWLDQWFDYGYLFNAQKISRPPGIRSVESYARVASLLRGRRRSLDTLQRMSEAQKHSVKGRAARSNLAALRRGIPLSTETKALISFRLTGIPHSPLHRTRLSEAAKSSPRVKALSILQPGIPKSPSHLAAIALGKLKAAA